MAKSKQQIKSEAIKVRSASSDLELRQRLQTVLDSIVDAMGSAGSGSGGSSSELKNIEGRLSALEKGGGDKTLIVEFGSADSKWTIAHEMNKFPSVSIISSDGECVMADVTYIDENNLEINFVEPLSGKAILN